MENTADILFENDRAEWYIALGDRWVGPLMAAEVYQKVLSQEITLAHFGWKAGQPDWKRLCDIPTFQAVVPGTPPAKPAIKQAEGRRGAIKPPAPVERNWFLYYNDSQFGPFSKDEIARYLEVGRINARVFAWSDGMAEWTRLDELEQFKALFEGSASRPPAPPQGGAKVKPDKRTAPRYPLVAKIMMAHDESVHVAVCRDISVGGLQVLTDKIPGAVGTKIKMNVSALGQIDPFVAEGIIVRHLEDQRGFSFRFERLSDEARKAIESYIRKSSP